MRDRQAELLVVRQAEELIDALAVGVAPAAEARGAHDHVVVLAERHAGALAVHFGRTGDEHGPAEAVGGLQHDLGAVDGGADGADRLVERSSCTPTADGQVEDGVALAMRVLTVASFSTESRTNWKPGWPSRPAMFSSRPGGEIVEHDDGVAVGEQALGEMRADEPRAAGDEETPGHQ